MQGQITLATVKDIIKKAKPKELIYNPSVDDTYCRAEARREAVEEYENKILSLLKDI